MAGKKEDPHAFTAWLSIHGTRATAGMQGLVITISTASPLLAIKQSGRNGRRTLAFRLNLDVGIFFLECFGPISHQVVQGGRCELLRVLSEHFEKAVSGRGAAARCNSAVECGVSEAEQGT
ncbi:MAG: hypothetical protein ABSA16_15060 [Thermoguttaceae bacterium]